MAGLFCIYRSFAVLRIILLICVGWWNFRAAAQRAYPNKLNGAGDSMQKGSCLCGGIVYELLSPLRAACHCHCTMCQKQHGAAFATYASVPRADLRYVCGENLLMSYTPPLRSCESFAAFAAPTSSGAAVRPIPIGFRLLSPHSIRRLSRTK